MSTQSDQTRAAVRCESCGAILVAEIAPDGSVRPLGTSEDCVCGDGAFTRLEQPAMTAR
ncbi:hypothetical protein [Natrinema versiforme]|uniref:Uncharacterized protein n=1 Tax=Natrinema versiforme JCM 10478 TaxID=1227496 RepID=L9XSY1_9EURY|nr:hypothetical protein [Natrinema versiforme]ELY64885.1 hypothetical protein C489_15761 [Natrinema versiforme JCM 10478]